MAVDNFFTGFEGCGQTSDIVSMFDSTYQVTYSATNGYDNGKCIYHNYTYFTKNITGRKTVVTGFHKRSLSTGNDGSLQHMLVRFNAGGVYLKLYNMATGLELYRDATLIASSATVIGTALTHIEVEILSDASAGTIEVRLNGSAVTFDNPTGLNTGGADITQVLWGGAGTHYTDNVYIATDFQGEMYSVLCNPSADSSVQFTPSAGSNYTCIDEDAQNGDTDYVESSTVGHKDLYAFEDIATSDIVVKFVSLVTVAKKDDAGARTLTPIAEQDASEYDQTTIVLATSYPATAGTASVNTFDVAPDTQAWTPTIFNAMTWGFKVAV